MALFILHPCQQLRQHHRRIRSPISIMTTMQAMAWTIDSDLKVSVAPRPENHGLLPALIHRPVAYQPHVAVDQVPVGIEDLLQVWRAGFFLALPYKSNIRAQRDPG